MAGPNAAVVEVGVIPFTALLHVVKRDREKIDTVCEKIEIQANFLMRNLDKNQGRNFETADLGWVFNLALFWFTLLKIRSPHLKCWCTAIN